MQQQFEKELSPEVREKMRKNMIFILIFSVMMLFGAFTSAYIVSMGDSFWIKFPFPTAFWISTAIILTSSLTFHLAVKSIKKGDVAILKLFISITLLLGLAFVYFQFQGYKQLTEKGANAVNNHIIVTDGRYGDYYLVKYNGNFIEVDGNKFYLNGREMTKKEMSAYQSFMKQFEKAAPNKMPVVSNYGRDFILYLNNSPLSLIDGILTKSDGQKLEYADLLRLSQLAVHVRDERGDFFLRGTYGKDFTIYFKGQELQYQNRDLLKDGKKLDRFLQLKAMDSADTATSYLYIITFAHLLHVVFTILFLIKLTINSLRNKFSIEEHISIKVGAIFWHFLGILWVYLLTFLIFIH